MLVCLFAMTYLFIQDVKAQNIRFEKITEFHGLSDNRVTCFYKDHTGFMWIGTENGLNRYDGFSFQIYKPGQKRHKISHERINAIAEDSQKRMWVATWNGLNLIDPKTDSLTVFAPDVITPLSRKSTLRSCLVWDICIDKQERIWLAPDGRDLCYYNQTKQEFIYYPWQDFAKQVLPDYPSGYRAIQRIIVKSTDELLLGTTAGLFSFNTKSGAFHFHGGDKAIDCIGLYYDSLEAQVYFSQEKIYRFDVNKNRLSEIRQSASTTSLLRGRTSMLLPSLSGLWNVDTDLDLAFPVVISVPDRFSLHHERINAVYRDQGITWIGTSSGVAILDSYMDVFPAIKILPDSIKETTTSVYHIYESRSDKKYYISCYGRNSLIVHDRGSGKQQEYMVLDGKPLTNCAKVWEDSQHRLWVLCARNIFVSDPSHQNFKVLKLPASDEYKFVDILEDREGTYWIASLTKGVYHYNPAISSWKLIYDVKKNFFAIRPTCMVQDTLRNTLWIGDFSYGVFQHFLGTDSTRYYGMDTNNSQQLQSSLINSLTLDSQGNLWVATTSGGVSRFNAQSNTFTTYKMEQGLPENTIHSIQADLHGNLWLASGKGLTVMKTSGEVIRHYDSNSGLKAPFNTPFSLTATNELMIGNGNQFLKFHPDSLHISAPEFPVVITAARQHDQQMDLGKTAVYTYDQNEFSFQFAALTYSLPQAITYYYKLEGFDMDWVDAGNNHTAHYTNLSHGSYTFQVRAVDHTGEASANVAQLTFVIRPPFWLQPWFVVLVSLAICALLYLWYRNLRRKIHSQKILNRVATSLYHENTIEDIFWTVARICVHEFKLQDCVIYLVDESRKVLIQKAAAGSKSSEQNQILNPIEIPLGKGIVGAVAVSKKAEIVSDTTKDARYIIDDQKRLSEITVPIVIDGKVFGIIDSEHTNKNFYSSWHLRMLKEIAAICSAKIGRYYVEEQIRIKVARDLHDDMGSTLSSIKIMSNIALEKNDPLVVNTYLKTIRENANTMQESMSDMVWAINPENDTLEKIVIRMKEFAAEILEPQDILYEFIEAGDFTHARMDLKMRKDFFLIYKEAINNAAKYSQCKRVTVDLKLFRQGVALCIRDDGKGFDITHQQNGNGLKNMHARAKNINAMIQIESVLGEGTSILVQAPIT